ncbi:MAG: hypothetical protein JPMHGGIA_01712 [Saprospiraceae bacterium]|jgi:hypothetical protein|nr:hypothetical protein [Saprospiraceae bacterium]
MHNSEIEKYVHGEMEGEELREFERRLSQDARLKAEVDQTRELIGNLSQLRLSVRILKAQQYNKRLKFIRWVLVAIIIGLGVFYCGKIFFSQNATSIPAKSTAIPDGEGDDTHNMLTGDTLKKEPGETQGDSLPEELKAPQRELPVLAWQDPHAAREMADYYFLTPEDFTFVRGGSAENLLDSAKMKFNEEDYHTTLLYLQHLSSTGHENPYFQAVCYFKLGRYAEADSSFLLTIDLTSDPNKTMELEWYGFLNALACGKPCRSRFEQLSKSIVGKPKHLFRSRVQSILQKSLDKK